jgi:hypothetical protein
MSYADRQRTRDAAYTSAYREWVASLPPEDREKLDRAGIEKPDTARTTSVGRTDELHLRLAAVPDASAGEDATAGAPPEDDRPRSRRDIADALASFCARIRAHPNPLLAFDAACFASGLMDVEGRSETELARRHGVTRAAFSKLVVQWTETFDLPPSRGMRSKKARRSYRNARLTHLANQHDRQAA